MAAEYATIKSEIKENPKCGKVTGFGDTGDGAVFSWPEAIVKMQKQLG